LSEASDLPGAILFACNMNSVRSPMAAGLMRHFWGRKVFVDSVGVRKGVLDPFATSVMDELGIDITRHQAKTFDELEDGSFDLVVSLTPEAHHKAIEMTRGFACEAEYWPIQDPTLASGSREQILDSYREARDALMRRIRQRFGTPQGVTG
jgi:protein-tyrosine-phosphatase